MKYVEYIQNGTGTGTESGWGIPLNYIPTDKNNISVRFKIDWTNLSNQDGVILLGCSQGYGNYFRPFSYRRDYLCFDCPSDADGRIDIPFTMGQETEFEAKWDNKTLTLTNLTTNQTVTGTTTATGSFTASWYVWKESTQVSVGVKIYYIDIYEDGTIVKQYRPALDANDVPCLYEELGGTYHYNYDSNKVLTVGPVLSSINAIPSKSSLSNEGETISIEVECENAWTVSQLDNWLTLSSTGDTSGTTITATAPSYSEATARVDTLTFTDSVTGDEVEITIRQKKYSTGQPMYLGADEISEIYLGEDAISEAYLGDVLVYSSGPFMGLKVYPNTVSFNNGSLTADIKVKSSEAWTMTVPSWISASVLTGGTGETTVTLTATTQSSGIQDTITVSSANYSASTYANYDLVQFVDYVHSLSMGNNNENYLTTSFYPTNATRGELIFQHRGYTTGNVLVGMYGTDSGWDNRDWRLFTFQSKYNIDLGSSRIANNLNGFVTGQDYDLSFGNNYIINNTNGLSVTGSTQTPTLDHIPINICLGVVWVKEVKLWEEGTLVFDGKAAKMDNQYGLYDTVSNSFLTTNDFTIVGEEQ